MLLSDSTITGNDGSFNVRVPMSFPTNTRVHGSAFFNFEINAIVTDMSGETHEAQTFLPLSNRNAILESNMPDKTLKDSLKSVVFAYKNLLGEGIEAVVIEESQDERERWKKEKRMG